MDAKVPEGVFPLYVVGKKSGRTLKWWSEGRLYICGISCPTTGWANIPNGRLCRVLATCLSSLPSGMPLLSVEKVESVEDQIMANCDQASTLFVGRKNQENSFIVPAIHTDLSYKIICSPRFAAAEPNQKIEVTVTNKRAYESIRAIVCTQVRELPEPTPKPKSNTKSKPKSKHTNLSAPPNPAIAAVLRRVRDRCLAHDPLFHQ